jgi:hypothetical protein
MDINQTNQVASIGNITRTFNEQQKFIEMDRYIVSKIYADWTAQGKAADTTALTTANILQVFDGYMQNMDEARVPEYGRLLYVTPAVYTLLKNAVGISRNIAVDKQMESEINRMVSRLDEVRIIRVASDVMKTLFDFTNGAVADPEASQINMFLIHTFGIISPVEYTFAALDEPSAKTQGKYYYYEEAFEDVFILNQRTGCIQFNITPYVEPQG